MQINESRQPSVNGGKLKIAIILPYFNDLLGIELYENTAAELQTQGVKKENITLYRVSGSLELPFAAQKIITKEKPDALIALGIVIEGETKHFDLVVETTHQGLMEVQLKHNAPIAFGILACKNKEQAIARIDKNQLNKGKEFAQAALIQATI